MIAGNPTSSIISKDSCKVYAIPLRGILIPESPQIMKIVNLLLRIAVAIILLQTLYFKFTGQPESVYIFTLVGMEPWGRIGSGIVELMASIALLVPSLVGIGALLTVSTMSGAVFFHLTKLGVEVQGDGGTLFFMALFCFFSSTWLTWVYKHQIPWIKNFFN